MAVLLAVFIPVLMLGVVLALGRYEELPGTTPPPDDPAPAPSPAPGPEASAASSGEADIGSGIEKPGRPHSV
ncbi:hypothetical protein [Streptomyces sp. NPDC000351]|uniref:hypothetical protein n=1 Tax=Streptomyces sp. NPDC000351 TaxID=3154250 RepID=UPI003330768B